MTATWEMSEKERIKRVLVIYVPKKYWFCWYEDMWLRIYCNLVSFYNLNIIYHILKFSKKKKNSVDINFYK